MIHSGEKLIKAGNTPLKNNFNTSLKLIGFSVLNSNEETQEVVSL